MAIGIAAHAARFFIYAIGDPLWLMVAVNVVHGMCYAFFFAAVYIFVDEFFPRDSRASAQGLFNLLILGLGPFVGSLLWGALGDRFHRRRPGRFHAAVHGTGLAGRGRAGAAPGCVPATNAEHGTALARRARRRHHGALQTKLLRVVRAAHARVLRDLRIGAQRSGHLDPVVDDPCGLDTDPAPFPLRASARAAPSSSPDPDPSPPWQCPMPGTMNRRSQSSCPLPIAPTHGSR